MAHIKKLSTLGLSLCILLLLLIAFYSWSQDPIFIGFSGPLTGVYSDLGVQGRNGATLAVEEINANGGIANRDLRLLSRDDRSSPEQTRKVDQELIKQGVAAVIGHMTSSQSMAALPAFEKAGVVLLSPTTSTPQLSEKKDMFFRVNTSSDRIARALGRFAREELGLTRINTVRDTDNQAYTKPYTSHFIQGFKEEEEKVPQECTFSSNRQKEWSGVVDCLHQEPAQGVMIAASARDTAALSGALKQRSWQGPVLCSGWAATQSLLAMGGSATEGIYLAKSGFADKETPTYQRFVRRYRERFGRDPSFPAVQGYHAAKVLARALEETGGKRKGLPGELTRIKDFSSFHGPLSMNEYGDVTMPVHILRVQKGAFTVVTQIEPRSD